MVGLSLAQRWPDAIGAIWGRFDRSAFTPTEGNDFYVGTGSADTVALLGGNDQAHGKGGDDTIDGGIGADVLWGEDGDDTLTGGAGDDFVIGGAGSDGLFGGDGNDVFEFASDRDVIDGGAGRDRLNFTAVRYDVTVDFDGRAMPRDGSFTLMGEAGQSVEDLLVTVRRLTGGDDTFLLGALWNKSLFLSGDLGDDRIEAGNRDSNLYGGDGDDTLSGFAGYDQLNGDDGNDRLSGGGGNDTLDGGTGDDALLGGNGGDTIDTGAGADRVDAGDDDDRVNDFFFSAGDILKGGKGTDVLYLTADGQPFFADLSRAQSDGVVRTTGGVANVSGFENFVIWLTASSDTVVFSDDQKNAVVLDGLAGNDRLTGGAGADRLTGGDGVDILNGGAGADTLDGGAGNDSYYVDTQLDRIEDVSGVDTVFASGNYVLGAQVERGTLIGDADLALGGNDGDNRLTGNSGDNVFYADRGTDLINGGEGLDTISYARGASVTIDLALERQAAGSDGYGTADTLISIEGVIGSAFGDSLRGNSGANRLSGGAGDDTLDGGDGEDILDGGEGFDTVSYAGSGSGVQVNLKTATSVAGGVVLDRLIGIEHIVGTAFGDLVVASDLGSTLDGGGGGDRIQGGAGDDVLMGETGQDSLSGNDGADTLIGGADDDLLAGGNGNDTVAAGDGNDRIDGGSGDDLIDAGEGSNRVNGGDGTDTVTFANATGAVRIDLTTGRATSANRADALTGIESAIGSAFADRLVGAGQGGTLDGGSGDDYLQGGRGSDTLIGGVGFDTVSYFDCDTGVTVRLDLEQATVNGGTEIDRLVQVEGAVGSRFADTLAAGYGGGSLSGEGGDDLLLSGVGDDLLLGGDGIDTASYARASVGVTVSLSLVAQETVGSGRDTLSGIENLIGSARGDTLTGDAGANTIDGGDGNDLLATGLGVGADVLIGGAGNDTADFSAAAGGVTVDLGRADAQATGAGTVQLIGVEGVVGSSYADRLSGGSGDDLLAGGDGTDTLTGGAGADVFLLTSTTDAATITDFVHGLDRVFFPGSIAGLTPGVLPDGLFRLGTTAQDADDRVLYDQGSGALYFDPDGVGGYDAIRVATLASHPVMSASDFIVI